MFHVRSIVSFIINVGTLFYVRSSSVRVAFVNTPDVINNEISFPTDVWVDAIIT